MTMPPNADLVSVIEAEFERRVEEYRKTGNVYLDGYADALDWVLRMLEGNSDVSPTARSEA